MKKGFVLTIFFSLIVMFAGCGQEEIKDAKNWPTQEFSFKNQNNDSFGSKELKGKVWIADFIFTTCVDVCPPMTANMAKLQDMVKDAGIEDVQFVSFSVDPEVDNPIALKEFGNKFKVDFTNWTFLTGYSQEEIETFAMKNFKAIVKKPEQADQVIYGTDFYLVDQNGKITKYYNGFKSIPFEEIIHDIKALQ